MNWSKYGHALLNVADKYYAIAGIAFLVFYVLLRKRIAPKKIQARYPTAADYRRELLFSTVSIVIFALPPLVLVQNDVLRPHTTFYASIPRHGWVYFFGVFPLLFLMHDTYFYWMHRLIHHPKLFRLFHLVHHRSVNPSPWSAYAFHPLEAFAESLIFVIFLFTLPINTWHLFVFFLLSLVYNVYGHLGFELYPAGFHRHWLGRWVNTSVSHNQHHRHFRGNYGLYFLFWDRVMGTLRKDYDAAYTEVRSRGKTVAMVGVLVLGAVLGGHAQVKTDAILGIWQTHGDKPAKIQIYLSGGEYYGKIVSLQNPLEDGKPVVDKNNPDASKRGQPVVGLVLLTGFKFDKDEWNDGHIYDPESGKTYSCILSLKDPNTLKVRGYVGISMFGRTEVWTRGN
jgi:sterol desaturase/sphingolipid hydroxylase (fatty acid hydroxylase superfamily)